MKVKRRVRSKAWKNESADVKEAVMDALAKEEIRYLEELANMEETKGERTPEQKQA